MLRQGWSVVYGAQWKVSTSTTVQSPCGEAMSSGEKLVTEVMLARDSSRGDNSSAQRPSSASLSAVRAPPAPAPPPELPGPPPLSPAAPSAAANSRVRLSRCCTTLAWRAPSGSSPRRAGFKLREAAPAPVPAAAFPPPAPGPGPGSSAPVAEVSDSALSASKIVHRPSADPDPAAGGHCRGTPATRSAKLGRGSGKPRPPQAPPQT